MHLMSHAALGLDVARHHQARLLAGLAEHELDLEHKVIKCPAPWRFRNLPAFAKIYKNVHKMNV